MFFSGEIVQRSEIAPGTEWELETETLSEGALFTVADGISGLLSHGRPILLQFNIGTKMCPRLESTRFWNRRPFKSFAIRVRVWT